MEKSDLFGLKCIEFGISFEMVVSKLIESKNTVFMQSGMFLLCTVEFVDGQGAVDAQRRSARRNRQPEGVSDDDNQRCRRPV